MYMIALVVGFIVLALLAAAAICAAILAISEVVFRRCMGMSLGSLGLLLPWFVTRRILANIFGDYAPVDDGTDRPLLVQANRLHKMLRYRAFAVQSLGTWQPRYALLALLPVPLLCLLTRAIGRQTVSWTVKDGKEPLYRCQYRALRIDQRWLIGVSDEPYVRGEHGTLVPASKASLVKTTS